MPYKLISLVFLLFFLITNKAYSENEFILPVKKPSIFWNFNNPINILKPQYKWIDNTVEVIKFEKKEQLKL